MCLLHQLDTCPFVFLDSLGSLWDLCHNDAYNRFTSIFFNRDRVVLAMAPKKSVCRLFARISSVSTVMAKHVVSVFSRTWVSVSWVGILMVGCGSCATHFYAPYPGISLFLVAVHLPRKGIIFVLADGIKEFVFTILIPDTWTHGWKRVAVSRRYYQPRRHLLSPAPGTFFSQGIFSSLSWYACREKPPLMHSSTYWWHRSSLV
jgi:hypothetical protein